MTKADVISSLQSQLEKKIQVLKSALADSNESASGDETKSEGKYDTRAIEASYLAEAQAKQLALAEESLVIFKRFEAPPFDLNDEIGPGALVEVEQDGEISFYLLAPTAGGLMIDYLGCDLTIVTPDSRLYQALSERKFGDIIDQPSLTITGVE